MSDCIKILMNSCIGKMAENKCNRYNFNVLDVNNEKDLIKFNKKMS